MKFENIKLDKSDHAKVDNDASVVRNVIKVMGIGIGIAAVGLSILGGKGSEVIRRGNMNDTFL